MSKMMYRGNTVSQGIGLGAIFVCKSPEININRDKIIPTMIENEITNLEVAVCKTYIELYDLYEGFVGSISEEEKRIIDIYTAVLDDIYFFEELKENVINYLITAENSIDKTINKYIDEICASENEYVKQRISDLNDIRVRLIRNVFSSNGASSLEDINNNHIVVVNELNPTLSVILGKKKVQGVITQEGGGYLSHSSIILRGAGIPVINSVEFNSICAYESSFAVVDGFEGLVLIEPDDPEIEIYGEVFKVEEMRKKNFINEDNKPLQTEDGHKIEILANVSYISDYKSVMTKNIDGIGLVRTETLFIKNKRMPGEKRQSIVYSNMLKGLYPKKVIIRTADYGGDKIPGQYFTLENKNIQNNRGIKWSLKHIDDFKVQLTALIKSSHKGNLAILLPMVETAEEIIICRELINSILGELTDKGYDIKKVEIGAMIETLAALRNLDQILNQIDFISIGTNDLINQVMGFSRKTLNNKIQEYFEPKFLDALNTIVTKAKTQKIPISICGEMAADPVATVILIGLGIENFSVSPSGIYKIRRTIKSLNYEVAKELTNRILAYNDINEVMIVLSGYMDTRV